MDVLIADDSVEVRDRLYKVISAKNGVNEVYVSSNTQEALDTFNNHFFDLIILDISMPGKGGLHVLEHIKNLRPETIVLMFTNYPYPQFKKRCKELKADYFFDKSDYQNMIGVLDKMFLGHNN